MKFNPRKCAHPLFGPFKLFNFLRPRFVLKSGKRTQGGEGDALSKEPNEADVQLFGVWAHTPLIELLKGFPNWVLSTL